MEIILLLLGFLLLIKGADFFVDGASSFATIFKIPSIIVGLTIISLGTSAPEAAVSVLASTLKANDIAISNVIGSNIFNLMVVLGTSALVAKITVAKNVIKFDFPFLVFISFLFIMFINFDYNISFIDAVILFSLIIFYITYLIYKSLLNQKETIVSKPKFSLIISLLLILIGIPMIVLGGNITVESAKKIALFLGMSEKLVGLTIVSIGTSLPELITSFIAAKKGEVDMALGNAVGSNIFNLLFILGLSGLINPMAVNPLVIFDAVVMLIVTVLCFILAKYNKNLNKFHGLLFLTIFITYLSYVIIRN